MSPKIRAKIRNLILGLVVVLTFPLWGAVYGRLIRFQTMGMLLSLFPGIGGLWLRRAYYYMTLEKAPSDISVGFCSVFLGRAVRLGTKTSVGPWCSVNDCSIGEGTLIGSHVDIFSGRHQHGGAESLTDDKSGEPTAVPETLIVIGKNVWIGNGATVFADVGDHSIIGAGAVVVKPIPAHCVAAGNPARVVKNKNPV